MSEVSHSQEHELRMNEPYDDDDENILFSSTQQHQQEVPCTQPSSPSVIQSTLDKQALDGNSEPYLRKSDRCHGILKTMAGVGGNVLEWYDFAVFGFFSDIIGEVFFPRGQSEDASTMESFAVFGGAFLMRPIGGIIIGSIGDVYGRKTALELSIFLMAFATVCMGILPTYDQIGDFAFILLSLVRLCQGLSVGGQLMSSLVFTLESTPHSQWGLYGSFVMAAANFGTFLGGIIAYWLRSSLSRTQLLSWGWRLPFISGILIIFCGIYLRYYCTEDEHDAIHHHNPSPTTTATTDVSADNTTNHRHHHRRKRLHRNRGGHHHGRLPMTEEDAVDADDRLVTADAGEEISQNTTPNGQQNVINDNMDATPDNVSTEIGIENSAIDPSNIAITPLQRILNPVIVACSKENRRSLFASALVPMLWSGGFYLSFVWMAIFMKDLIQPPIQAAFGINSCSLLILSIVFPLAGMLSDKWSERRTTMTIGGIGFGLMGPIALTAIGKSTAIPESHTTIIAFVSQTILGISLALWGAPMCAWLVEAFEPKARLTSVAIGYNVAQAIAGGMSPFIATALVSEKGPSAPGALLFGLAICSLTGLWIVAPAPPPLVEQHTLLVVDDEEEATEASFSSPSSIPGTSTTTTTTTTTATATATATARKVGSKEDVIADDFHQGIELREIS